MHRFWIEPDILLFTHQVSDVDFLIPHICGAGTIPIPLEPMSYASMLSWLRYVLQIPWKVHNFSIPVQSYTVHSCKTTVLSWASQLPHGAISSEQRHLQGHHSYQSSISTVGMTFLVLCNCSRSLSITSRRECDQSSQFIAEDKKLFPHPRLCLRNFQSIAQWTNFVGSNFCQNRNRQQTFLKAPMMRRPQVFQARQILRIQIPLHHLPNPNRSSYPMTLLMNSGMVLPNLQMYYAQPGFNQALVPSPVEFTSFQ